MNIELRLQVMMSINHPETYYQQALKSIGVDFTTLSHDQICAWKAALKAVEADLLIQYASEAEINNLSKVDLSFCNQKKEPLDPHCTSSVECPLCGNKWQAVYPLGTTSLECPNCSIISSINLLCQ